MISARRNLALLWSAQFISEMGNAVVLPCAAWLATEVSGQNFSVGLVVFVAAVPYLLIGPWAGALVDRRNRRAVMIVSDLVRAGVLLALPLWVLWWGQLDLALLITVVFVVGVSSVPFLPARDAMIPQLAGSPKELSAWNATIQTSAHLAIFVGLGVGGWLLASGASRDRGDVSQWVLQLDGLTFVVSALLLIAMRVPKRGRAAVASTSYWEDTRAGLSLAKRDPTVRALLQLTAANNLFLMGPALVGPPLLIRHVYGLDVSHLAWFECAMAGGMVLSALLMARWPLPVAPGHVLLVALILDGITYLPFVWIRDYPLALVAIALHGFFIPPIVVSRTTLVQRHVASDKRGRVFSLMAVTVQGMTAISALIVGALAQWIPANGLFGIAGVFATLTGLWGLRTSPRTFFEDDREQAAEST